MPKQLDLHFKAAGKRILRERNELTRQAWLIGQLAQADFKTYPKLEMLIDDGEPTKPQSVETQIAMVRAINAAVGGRVVKKGK